VNGALALTDDRNAVRCIVMVNPDGPANSNGRICHSVILLRQSQLGLHHARYFHLARELKQPFCRTYGRLHQQVQVRNVFVLAECLTSDEASKRLQEDEQRKKAVKGKAAAAPMKAVQTHNLSAKSRNKPAGRKLKLSSQKHRKPVFVKSNQAQLTIRKPTWMTNGGLQQKSCQSVSNMAESVTDESLHGASAEVRAISSKLNIYCVHFKFIYIH